MTRTDDGKLLPCPFCFSTHAEAVTDDGAHWIRCASCGATGPLNTRYSGEEGEEYASWQSRPRYTKLLLELSELRTHNTALRAHQQDSLSVWVAVSERLPEPLEAVLFAVSYQDGASKGYYVEESKDDETGEVYGPAHFTEINLHGGTEFELHEVTHWMPLPKPPALLPPNTEAK